MKRFLLALACVFAAAPAYAGNVCYFLIDEKGEVTSYIEPPWDISYPPKPVSAEERKRREKMGHLVVSMINGECFDTAKEKSAARKGKQADEAPMPAPKAPSTPTTSISLDLPLSTKGKPAVAAVDTPGEVPVELTPKANDPAEAPAAATGVDCASKTRCADMSSCEEAKQFMQECGLAALDEDGDGEPCESLCTSPAQPGTDTPLPSPASEDKERRVVMFEGHTGNVTSVGMYSGKAVSNSPDNNEFKIWEVNSKAQRNISGLKPVSTLIVSGNQIIIGFHAGNDNLQLWDLQSGRNTRSLHGHDQDITDLALAGSVLASASKDRTVRVWNLDNSKNLLILYQPVSNKNLAGGEGFSKVSLDAKLKLVAGASGSQIYIWNYEQNALLKSLDTGARVTTLAACQGRLLAGTEADGDIKVWNMADGKELPPLQSHIGAVEDVICVHDRVVSAGQDGAINIWQAGDGSLLESLVDAHGGIVLSLGYEGKHLISGSKDTKVKVWFNYLEPLNTPTPEAPAANPKAEAKPEAKPAAETPVKAEAKPAAEKTPEKPAPKPAP